MYCSLKSEGIRSVRSRVVWKLLYHRGVTEALDFVERGFVLLSFCLVTAASSERPRAVGTAILAAVVQRQDS